MTVPYDANIQQRNLALFPWFWTYHTELFIGASSQALPNGLNRCGIADSSGDWCGSILLLKDWVAQAKTARHEFIDISQAWRFSQEECRMWSCYASREQEESEWELFYVLLIERKQGRWERVGLGKVFQEVFREVAWREIVLA